MEKTTKRDGKHVNILGVRIDSTSISSVLRKIEEKLTFEAKFSQHDKFYIVTPNPEIVLQAQNDKRLQEVINEATFSLPDGFGLKLFGNMKLNILTGREVMLRICELASEKDYKVFLLGSSSKSNAKSIQELKLRYKGLKISGIPGANYDKDANPVSQNDLNTHFDTIDKINRFKPDIMFVALGAPKQEKWIAKYLPIVKARGAMTVGGALDYLAGEASLPPDWLAKLHFEWLWRLINEPERILRVANALIIFPFTVLTKKVE